MFETAVAAGVLQVHRPDARWLATGNDGFATADAAYNVSVPQGFDRTDLTAYVRERREDAGFAATGPALLTAVPLEHARGARSGQVEVLATAGLSNPAVLPADPAGATSTSPPSPERGPPGTVNLLVGTTRALDDGALSTLLATAVEAKTATLRAETGVPGTTTDGVVVGSDPGGDPATFAGSATPVGAATRACVREAVRASLRAHYPDRDYPDGVDDAEYGVRTERAATVFEP